MIVSIVRDRRAAAPGPAADSSSVSVRERAGSRVLASSRASGIDVRGPARPRRRGAVAVELALTICFVIVPMMVGIWEIGCLLDAQQTLVEAAREGGRQAATGQVTNAQVQQVVLQYLSNAGVNTTNVTVAVTNTGSGADASQAAQLDPLIVSATLPFANVDWSMTGQFVPHNRILTTTCQWYSAKDVPYTVPQTAPVQ